MRRNCQGMTLLELLVAVAIFAVLAALAYGGLNAVLNTSRSANSEAERLASIQRVLALIGADIEQMANRPVRDGYGDTLDVIVSEYDKAQGSRLEFTRHGRLNPAGSARSSMQRVAYHMRESQLIRQSWDVLDRAQDSEPFEADLLDNVKRFEVRYIASGTERQLTWQASRDANAQLPLAVEVMLELEDWGEIIRLYRVTI